MPWPALPRIDCTALPLWAWYRWRAKKGKEDLTRIDERFGIASALRPPGTVVWVHAVSVGECRAVEPLLIRLNKHRADCQIVMTTGTVAASHIVERAYSVPAIHQYLPFPSQRYINRFIQHWQPSLLVVCESELWPAMFQAAADNAIPTVVVNGRMSKRSAERWSKWPKIARKMGTNITRCLVQSEIERERFSTLKCADIRTVGNLKFDAPLPSGGSPDEVSKMLEMLTSRPVWIAASTRPGEEQEIITAHKKIVASVPGACTIWVPRHRELGNDIASMLEQAGIQYTRRSHKQMPDKELFLGDTIGEMGLYYRLAPIAFLGGSLNGSGGQNPIEPLRLGCCVVSGPDVQNYFETYTQLWSICAAGRVDDGAQLGEYIIGILGNADKMKRMLIRGRASLSNMSGAADKTWSAIADLI